ncbi:MAG: hypothetical protein ACKVTZ_17585 [Bacteroidia bacterium]
MITQRYSLITIVLGLFVLLFPANLWAQPGGTKPATPPASATASQDEKPHMFFVALDVTEEKDIPIVFSNKCDKERVKIYLDQDKVIDNLSDLSDSEDEMQGPECFLPELKLIYKNHTYAVSMHCTTIKMYRNSAPYTPSATLLRSDVEMTQSVYYYLLKLKKQHYPNLKPNAALLAKLLPTIPLVEAKGVKDDDTDLDPKSINLFEEDDAEEDKELENTTTKESGEFDKLEVDDDSLDDGSGDAK